MTPPDPTPPPDYIRWLRGLIGHQPTYLVFAGAVIFDDAGRILAQHRADFDAWGLPGGAMEVDEPLYETARREVREETGLDVSITGLVGLYTHPQHTTHYPNGDIAQPWTACFLAEVVSGALQADGEETLAVFWAEPEAFLARAMPVFHSMVRDALRVRAGETPPLEPVETPGPLDRYQGRLRAAVGHAPLILPGAVALIEDEAGRLLLTRRTHDACWDFPAGYAELGETSTANIAREVREETGLIVEPYALVGLYSEPRWWRMINWRGDEIHDTAVAYACRVVGGELVSAGADHENTAIAYRTDADIIREGCNAATRQLLADYRARDGWPFWR